MKIAGSVIKSTITDTNGLKKVDIVHTFPTTHTHTYTYTHTHTGKDGSQQVLNNLQNSASFKDTQQGERERAQIFAHLLMLL